MSIEPKGAQFAATATDILVVSGLAISPARRATAYLRRREILFSLVVQTGIVTVKIHRPDGMLYSDVEAIAMNATGFTPCKMDWELIRHV